MTPEPESEPEPNPDDVRARQLGRAKVMAWLLFAFVVLVFAISIVKMQIGHG